MVICICNNINDKTIASMVSNGAGLETIQKETGATTCCGCCHEMVCSLISKGQESKKEGK
jgi:hypothetical protein